MPTGPEQSKTIRCKDAVSTAVSRALAPQLTPITFAAIPFDSVQSGVAKVEMKKAGPSGRQPKCVESSSPAHLFSCWHVHLAARLRAEGAFVVSAALKDGELATVPITSEKGGKLRLQNPFRGAAFVVRGARVPQASAVFEIDTSPGRRITFQRKSPRSSKYDG